MKAKSTAFIISLLFLFNSSATLVCQQDNLENTIPHPTDLIDLYPEITWEMSIKETANILENNNIQPVNTIPTELAWDGEFNGIKGRSSVYFQNDQLSGFTILFYTKDQTQEVADKYKEGAASLYGEPTSDYNTSEFNIVTWKSGKDYLVKIQRSNNPNSPLVIVSWIKQSKLY